MRAICEEDEGAKEILSYSNESDYLSDINGLIDLINTKLVHCKTIEYNEYKQLTCEFIKQLNKYQEQPYVLDTYLERLCSPLTNCMADFLENNSLILHKTVVSLSESQSQGFDANSEAGLKIIRDLYLNIDTNHHKNILRLSDCIYNLCKIRGSKIISLYFPSSVGFLEVVIDYISLREKCQLGSEHEDSSNVYPDLRNELEDLFHHDEENWHFTYVLYVWLSTLVLIPFSFEVLDSKYMIEPNHLFLRILESVVPKVLENKYCVTNEVASMVFAKVACRVDFILLWSHESNKFSSLLSRGLDEIQSSLGVLTWIKYLIKLAPVESIEVFVDQIIKYLCIPNDAQSRDLNGSYRHHDINHSYKSTCCRTICITRLVIRCTQSNVLAKHFLDFEGLLDWVLELLVEQNKSENSLLRHTSSKCIAKIIYTIKDSSRAERFLNNMLLIESQNRAETLKGLSPNELEGKCLTVAELLRTRVAFIFERYLPEILEFLQYCLNYEFWSGSRSYGVQIRDSACYIIWSLARGVPPEALRPYSSKIISSILPLTVFDSQINGRRSSCAALQELIGRIGGENVPFGISIVTIADFFSISSIKSSFLEVSTRIGALDATNGDDLGSQVPSNYQDFGNYESSIYPFAAILSDYLVQNVFIHPNTKIRLLSTIALSKLVPFCYHLCFFSILPFVSRQISKGSSPGHVGNWNGDLNIFSSNSIFRHSSLLIISILVSKGSILKSRNIPFWDLLSEAADQSGSNKSCISRDLGASKNPNSTPAEFTWSDYVRNIPILIEKNRLYRGKGGDLTRKGVLNLVCSLAKSTEIIPFKKATFSRFLQTICESIKHLSFSIQISGCSTLDAMIKWRMVKARESTEFLEIHKLLVNFVESLDPSRSDLHIMAVRGIILSIGIIFTRVSGLIEEELVNDIVTSLIGVFYREKLITREEGGQSGSGVTFSDLIFSSKYDIECRRNSVWSLGMICYCMRGLETPSKRKILDSCHDVFVQGCFDYSTDKRGDVGSWIRELSMETLACLYCNGLYREEPEREKVLSAFMFNVFNYSDKLRVKAILLLWKLLSFKFMGSGFVETESPSMPVINMYWIYYRIFHGIPFELFEICQIRNVKVNNCGSARKLSLEHAVFESCHLILQDILKDYSLIHSDSYIGGLSDFFTSEDNPFNSGCYFFDMMDSIERVPHSLLAHLDFENQFLFFLSNRNFQALSSSNANVFKKCLFPLILEQELQKSILLGLVNWISHSSSLSSSSSINPYNAINYELNIFLKSTPDVSAASLPIFINIETLLRLLSACGQDAAFLCTCITLHALQFILVLFTWGIFPSEKDCLRGILDAVLRVLADTQDFQLIKVSSAILVHMSFSIGALDRELSGEAMESLSDLVSHKYPNIRVYTSDYIYNNICHIQSSDKVESILEFIREINWAESHDGEELSTLKTRFKHLYLQQ
ncbi:b-tubulin specific chaparone [Cryptosporidium canis]|nr:b-tubulin specific chaparone [Cryptosporidium canis]